MKRIVSLLFIVFMLLMLSACGAQESAPTDSVEPAENEHPEIREISMADVEEWLIVDNTKELSSNLPYISDDDKKSILDAAITFDAPECAAVLVEDGVSVPKEIDGTPLFDYSFEADSGTGVAYALAEPEHRDVSYQDLVDAVKNWRFSVANTLIDYGVDPSTIGTENYTILHELADNRGLNYANTYHLRYHALASEDFAEARKLGMRQAQMNAFYDTVLKSGVDINAETIYGMKATDGIEEYGQSMILSALIGAGIEGWDDDMVFRVSAKHGDTNLLEYLSDKGYDVNSDSAVESLISAFPSIPTTAYPYSQSYLYALKEAGYDFDAPVNDEGETYFFAYFHEEAGNPYKGITLCSMYDAKEIAEMYSVLIMMLAICPPEDIDWRYPDDETLYYKILSDRANHQMTLYRGSGTFYSKSADQAADEYYRALLKMLVDAGANPNPQINGKYAMQIIEENGAKYAPVVIAAKEDFGLH